MKIGIIRDTFFTTETRGLNIARFLKAAGFEVYVLCYGEKNFTESIDGIILDRFHLNRKIKNKLYATVEVLPFYKILWARKIKKFVKKYKIDVLQVHDLYMLGAALKANKNLQLKLIANFHENYIESIKTYTFTQKSLGKIVLRLSNWERKEKNYLSKIDGLIVLSDTFKNHLLNKYKFLSDEQICVYPNVPDIEELNKFTIDKNIIDKTGSFIIFYFGHIAKRRGIFTTFEMLKKIAKKIDVKLLLIGPVDKADQPDFYRYLSDPEIKDSIIHYSWKDIKYLPSYISVSDVCISPIIKNAQHDTGVATKVFQYMAFAKPVVVSDSVEQARVGRENNCGLIFSSEDAEDFAEKILELYNNLKLRIEMGKNGQKAASEIYNTKFQSKRLIDYYKKIEDSFYNKV